MLSLVAVHGVAYLVEQDGEPDGIVQLLTCYAADCAHRVPIVRHDDNLHGFTLSLLGHTTIPLPGVLKKRKPPEAPNRVHCEKGRENLGIQVWRQYHALRMTGGGGMGGVTAILTMGLLVGVSIAD